MVHKLEDVWNEHIDVEELPDEVHKELTCKKLANELIRMAKFMDNMLMSNDLVEIKKYMTSLKMRQIKLVASMIHLFDWMDAGDIIYQTELRQLMEEYLIRKDIKLATGKCNCKKTKEDYELDKEIYPVASIEETQNDVDDNN